MLLRIVMGSFRRHLCSSSCIFSTLAGLSAHRQPLREVLPFLFSTFSKHLFRDRLCRTEFFHPSGAVWTQEEKDKWRTFMLKEFKQIFLSQPLGCWDTSNDFKQTGQFLLMAHECYYDSLFWGTPCTEFQTEHFSIVSTVFFPHLEYDFERNSTSLAWLSSAACVTFLLKYLESNYKLIVNHLIKSGYSVHPAGNITTHSILILPPSALPVNGICMP